jgi:hypothetical protein
MMTESELRSASDDHQASYVFTSVFQRGPCPKQDQEASQTRPEQGLLPQEGQSGPPAIPRQGGGKQTASDEKPISKSNALSNGVPPVRRTALGHLLPYLRLPPTGQSTVQGRSRLRVANRLVCGAISVPGS